MNVQDKSIAGSSSVLVKASPDQPALVVTGRDTISIRAGTAFGGQTFPADMPIMAPEGGYEPGTDYAVVIGAAAAAVKLITIPSGELYVGGFHFAPGGNAAGRSGGDDRPAINPYSCWDLNFRPACPDPRGMTLVDAPRGPFWCDIYLCAADHLKAGTSAFGATIADGDTPPENPDGGRFDECDYATAVAVMKHHGKTLLGFDEFAAAAYGVTEKTAHKGDPKVTKLAAPRTSKWGVMQATGNLWVWGHDGDPDEPRPSVFGGSWFSGSGAGSRCAGLGSWPGDSGGGLGARGRSDHLQLG